MEDVLIFRVWGIGSVLGFLFVSGYAAWMREVCREPAGVDVMPLIVAALFWPIAVMAAVIGFSGWLFFYLLPGEVARAYVARRERVARAEAAAKLAADEAHYEVERGAHR